MVKFLRFKLSNGKTRLFNINACDIIKLKDADTIEIFPVPFVDINTEWNIERDTTVTTAINFDGALVDLIYDALIKAELNSYANPIVDVNVPSKYAILDIRTIV
tara:strand:- start:869 stop:1180 length:312 start_codon:yes stop_codon:yes gene_type:complete